MFFEKKKRHQKIIFNFILEHSFFLFIIQSLQKIS
uniref:Uncharacterized protein n=1 Tax=viral metagenome TaxID=1070528 RepID=A0A6C0K6C9_9ZZZZ